MKNIFSNKYKKKYLLIVFIMIDVVLISIAYAVLSTSLKVKVSSVSNAESIWNVHFKTETVTATSTGSNNGHSCGTASSSGNTVTINNTTLSKPNDKCVWELTIQNEGTIDAEIAQMVVTNPTGTDVTQIWRLDSDFHKIIYDASRSRPLRSTLSNFHNYIKKARCNNTRNSKNIFVCILFR